MMRTPNARSLSLVVAAGTMALFHLPASSAARPDAGSASSAIVTRPLGSAAAGEAPGGLTLTGRVQRGGQQPALIAPADAVVIGVEAPPGTVVRRGSRLLRLGGPGVLALIRELDESVSAATLAEQRLRRDAALLDAGAIAHSRLQETSSIAQQARARLQAVRGGWDAAGLRRASGPGTTVDVVSPVAGRVAGRAWTPGSTVSSGAELGRIDTGAPLTARLDASPNLAARVSPGDAVRVRGRDCEAAGRVQAVGDTVDEGTQGIVVAVVLQATSCVLPGQAVTASITPTATARAGWPVPASSLVRHDGIDYVFVLRSGSYMAVAVDARAAAVSRAASPLLKADDRLVVAGTTLVKAAWISAGSAQ